MSMATATLTRPASPRRERPAKAVSRGGGARVAVAALCACAALVTGAPLAQAATPYTAYVSNLTAESLSPINTATNIVGSPIPAKNPPFLAITPDGTTAWVTNSTQGTVTPITLATGAAGAPISVGTGPYAIAITPDGSKAYVAIHGAEAVTPVNLITRTAGSPIKVGKEPWAIAITPDGSRAYVTNYGSSSVTPINTATQTAGGEIKVGSGPQSIAIAPNGTTAWVADFTANAITPITLATNTAGPTVEVKEPNSLAITPSGTAAYVTDYALNTVTPVNLATRTVGTPIKVGSLPYQVAITPDGSTAYVTNNSSNSVTPINTATQTAGGEIKVGTGPDGIAITPDEAPVASFTVSAAQAGSPSSFNASSSSVAHGTITSYAWSFGDGSTATTSAPTTTHTYAAAGNYTATLTETDSAGTSTAVVFTGQTVSRNGGPSAQTTRTVSVANAPTSSVPGDPRPTRVVISIRSATVNRHGVAVIPLLLPRQRRRRLPRQDHDHDPGERASRQACARVPLRTRLPPARHHQLRSPRRSESARARPHRLIRTEAAQAALLRTRDPDRHVGVRRADGDRHARDRTEARRVVTPASLSGMCPSQGPPIKRLGCRRRLPNMGIVTVTTTRLRGTRRTGASGFSKPQTPATVPGKPSAPALTVRPTVATEALALPAHTLARSELPLEQAQPPRRAHPRRGLADRASPPTQPTPCWASAAAALTASLKTSCSTRCCSRGPLCASRAHGCTSAERGAWCSLGVGLFCWAIGEVIFTLDQSQVTAGPFPSTSDFFWLIFYPAAFLTLGLLVRARVRHFYPSLWLDGVIGALAVAALASEFLLPSIIASSGGSLQAVVGDLIYPLGDLLLICFVVAVLAITGWRPGRVLGTVSLGLLIGASADVLSLYWSATGHGESSFFETLWPASAVVLGLAAWQPARPSAVIGLHGRRLLVFPLCFALAGIGLLSSGGL